MTTISNILSYTTYSHIVSQTLKPAITITRLLGVVTKTEIVRDASNARSYVVIGC